MFGKPKIKLIRKGPKEPKIEKEGEHTPFGYIKYSEIIDSFGGKTTIDIDKIYKSGGSLKQNQDYDRFVAKVNELNKK